MTIDQIKKDVDEGKTVFWVNHGYRVIKDSIGQYLIVFEPNGNVIGLTNRAGTRLNGAEADFYLGEAA
ncbi:hypothetical protein [Palleronia caenipelagi]|uniref:Uncharacterized protein n=1 Tax=Palleronia caenipelagi TaxID=2489174 RepID=A0A547PNS5_9RHOB|nr:hypothetical protein [Palleronia caenipelagi]TRD15771.1 hypothetical protein FEV53_15025 [Palleronia caenipelagi]